MSRRDLMLALVLPACLLSGCAAFDTGRAMMSQTIEAIRPNTDHYNDPTSASGDPWVQSAGVEARGERPMTQANDPLGLRNVFMSEKARDIERNVGFE